MTTSMNPPYNPMTQYWSSYYDANMAQNQKKLGKPHITQSFSASPNLSSFSFTNVLSSKPRLALFSVPNTFTYSIKTPINTGEFCSALPLKNFRKTLSTFIIATFNIANELFTDTFLLLMTMNETILEFLFFEKKDTPFHPNSRTLKPSISILQLTKTIHANGKISAVSSKKNHFLRNNRSLSISPNTTELVQCSLPNCSYLDGTVAIIEPHPMFENQTGLCVNSSLITPKAKPDFFLAILNVLITKLPFEKICYCTNHDPNTETSRIQTVQKPSTFVELL